MPTHNRGMEGSSIEQAGLSNSAVVVLWEDWFGTQMKPSKLWMKPSHFWLMDEETNRLNRCMIWCAIQRWPRPFSRKDLIGSWRSQWMDYVLPFWNCQNHGWNIRVLMLSLQLTAAAVVLLEEWVDDGRLWWAGWLANVIRLQYLIDRGTFK